MTADAVAAADNARCPRCGETFHCGSADPTPCACSTLTLPAATLAALRARHVGCLCLSCLRAVADGVAIEPPARDGA